MSNQPQQHVHISRPMLAIVMSHYDKASPNNIHFEITGDPDSADLITWVIFTDYYRTNFLDVHIHNNADSNHFCMYPTKF